MFLYELGHTGLIAGQTPRVDHMNKSDLVYAAYEELEDRYPEITYEMVEAMMHAMFRVIIVTTVTGEPVELGGIMSFWPKLVTYKNKAIDGGKKTHITFKLALRHGEVIGDLFKKYRDEIIEITEREEEDGKVRVQAQFRNFGHTRREDGKRKGDTPMSFVRRADDGTTTELPDPWLEAVRKAADNPEEEEWLERKRQRRALAERKFK